MFTLFISFDLLPTTNYLTYIVLLQIYSFFIKSLYLNKNLSFNYFTTLPLYLLYKFSLFSSSFVQGRAKVLRVAFIVAGGGAHVLRT